jgi:rhamnogalacturonan endolyase
LIASSPEVGVLSASLNPFKLLFGWLKGGIVRWTLIVWIGGSVHSVFANNPGGFTNLVATPVTTGTELFGSRTDRYLDNGILHVLISTNGSVDSIKYLKPGLAGTPKANGTEMVSQSGANFGNHTAIYYYWYPDGNGDCLYLNTTTSSTNIDLGYLRTYSPARNQVVADVELHYMLGKGNTGLYAYLIVRHPSSYASYPTNLNISFIQCIWPTAHDNTNFLCENSYVDDDVRYGLTLSGVHQKRNGLQPNFWDDYHTVAVPGLPAEVTQFTTGVFAGSTNGKYSYTFDYPKLGTFGMASDINKVGLWFVAGGHEYQNNGPTACEYSGGIGGLVTFEPLIAHYGNTGLTVSSNANYTQIYGPWLFYFNNGSNGAACWLDSQNQVAAEQQAWPYTWLTNTVYQPRSQRAIVSGRLVISDPLRPQASAAGAWIGLAAPDSGGENAPNNWQLQSDGYQFWTQVAEDGTFTLPPVTTFSPYGGAATYQLYAYCAGTNGSVGEFRAGPFSFSPGTVTNLGTLTWTVPHQGSSVAWEIGYPDRTAVEFRHGDDYAVPGLWLGFSSEFSNPTTYTVESSNWTNDWNYVQGAYWVGTNASNMIWNIQFYLPRVPTSGNATLNTIWAGAFSAAIQVYVNDPNRTGAVFRDFYPNVPAGANTLVRQGIHDKYGIDHTSIPVNRLIAGTNTITLIQRRAVTATSTYVMYDYVNLELPTAGTPSGLSAVAGDAQVSLNWTSSPGAGSYKLKRATVSGGPYSMIVGPGGTNTVDATVTNGTTYYYVVSAINANGESADSMEVSATPSSAIPPQLTFSSTGGQLQFSWPAENIGWELQVQTNMIDVGLGTNWVTIPGSGATNLISIPIGMDDNVFFRLAHP